MIDDPQRTVPGTPMPKVPMPRSTRELIIAFLTRAPVSTEAAERVRERGTDAFPRRSGPSGATEAAALYGRFCASCHGPRGRGDGPNADYLPARPAAHADPAFMSRRSDDRLFDAIFSGGYPLGRSAAMPPYGETLTTAEIWSLVRYLRALCRCSGPGWSTDGVPTSDTRRPR